MGSITGSAHRGPREIPGEQMPRGNTQARASDSPGCHRAALCTRVWDVVSGHLAGSSWGSYKGLTLNGYSNGACAPSGAEARALESMPGSTRQMCIEGQITGSAGCSS